MKKVAAFLAVSILTTVSGCANGPAAPNPSPPATESRVYLGDCTVFFTNETAKQAGFLAVLAAAIVPSLISNGLDRLAAYLEEAGKDKPFTTVAYRNFEATQEQSWQCIYFVRGRFQANATTPKQAHIPVGLTDAEKTRFGGTQINLYDAPDVFLEMRVIPSSNKKAWTLFPTYFEYGASVEDGGATSHKRNLAVIASFHGPSVPPSDGKQAQSATLPLGDHITGINKRFEVPEVIGSTSTALRGTWGALKPSSVDGKLYSPWSPTFVTQALTEGGTMPLTVTVTFTETRPGSELAKFLAGVLKGSKAGIQAELEKQLIPSKAEAAELADLESDVNAEKVYNEAHADRQLAKIDYCASQAGSTDAAKKDRLNKAKTLASAQAKLRIAAAKAGKGYPQQKDVPISENPIDTSICSS